MKPRSPLPPRIEPRWDLFPVASVNTGKSKLTVPKGIDSVAYEIGHGKPPKQFQWKPGQTGNPDGGRAHNPAIRALRKLTIELYREVIEVVLTGNMWELEAIENDPETPAIQVGVAKSFRLAITRGDWLMIEQVASRIVGKIPEQLIVESKNLNANINVAIDNEKMKAALKALEEKI